MTDSNTPERGTPDDDADGKLSPLGWLLVWGFLAAILLWPVVQFLIHGNV